MKALNFVSLNNFTPNTSFSQNDENLALEILCYLKTFSGDAN